ncbi:MAG TPA: NUDIX hydrolase [Thermoanaerobaculia bacterium]|jgi:8-oxo-dGTP pyrophosphatase MutT (NUDIX family)|nr:NUDIX hydrolase [Thermoanaerobaculia bacterium]
MADLPPPSAAVLDLLGFLATARRFDERDRDTLRRIEEFVRANEDCLLRSNLAGHLTGSAFVVDRGRERLLLIHHKALGRWLQPGGHADGDPDLVAVARREVLEETGVGALDLLVPGPWDLDIHLIPERRGVPAHLHYDVRFLFSAGGGTDLQSDEREVHAAAWVPLADLASLGIEESVLRPAGRIALLQ